MLDLLRVGITPLTITLNDPKDFGKLSRMPMHKQLESWVFLLVQILCVVVTQQFGNAQVPVDIFYCVCDWGFNSTKPSTDWGA